MQYRIAQLSDSALLASMNQHLIQDENHRNSMTVAELEQRMTGWLASQYQAVIFEQAETVYGYALFREEPEYIYLRHFYVKKEHRREGIGRAALKWLHEHLWGSGKRIRLDVLVDNSLGIAFWKSVGFREYCLTLEKD